MEKNSVNNSKDKLGRWLGVSHIIGHGVCYWVLPKSGIPVSRKLVFNHTNMEEIISDHKLEANEYEKAVEF